MTSHQLAVKLLEMPDIPVLMALNDDFATLSDVKDADVALYVKDHDGYYARAPEGRRGKHCVLIEATDCS